MIGFDANAKIYILAILGDAALCWDISLGRFVANLPAIAGELASENKKIWKINTYPGLDTTNSNLKMYIQGQPLGIDTK